jgi:AcrR family transcriptional regulator
MASITRKKRPGRADSRTPTKQRLLLAVERLLSRGESFTEMSVGRLIAEAGVSRSTFYVHFADKGELLRALTSDIADELATAASVCWDLPANTTREDVTNGLLHLVEVYLPHADLLAAIVEMAGYDAVVRAHWISLMEQVIADAATHIRRGQGEGSIRSDVRPVETAQWLIWMIERGVYQLVRNAAPTDARALIDELGNIIWYRLYESRPSA